MPYYDLKDVIVAANNQDIVYPRRSTVARDIDNLGYELRNLSDCLSRLQASDFRKTHHYSNSPPMDDYVVNYQKRSTDAEDFPFDELYIKFRLVNGNLIIELVSFHLSQ